MPRLLSRGEITNWFLYLLSANLDAAYDITLNIANNLLRKVPDALYRCDIYLKNVRSVSFAQNSIKQFPIALKKMTSLRFLNIKGCSLKVFPEFILGLTMLEKLWLDHNRALKVLPKNLPRTLEELAIDEVVFKRNRRVIKMLQKRYVKVIIIRD